MGLVFCPVYCFKGTYASLHFELLQWYYIFSSKLLQKEYKNNYIYLLLTLHISFMWKERAKSLVSCRAICLHQREFVFSTFIMDTENNKVRCREVFLIAINVLTPANCCCRNLSFCATFICKCQCSEHTGDFHTSKAGLTNTPHFITFRKTRSSDAN